MSVSTTGPAVTRQCKCAPVASSFYMEGAVAQAVAVCDMVVRLFSDDGEALLIPSDVLLRMEVNFLII